MSASDFFPLYDPVRNANPLGRNYDPVRNAGAYAPYRSLMETAMPANVFRAENGDLVPVPREADPTGKNPHEPGAKLDAGKAPVFRGLIDYFPRACKAVSIVSQKGAEKYAWKGWETVPDGLNRYSDALMRHLLSEAEGERVDPATGLAHAAHAAWNALARLELLARQIEDEGKAAERG